MTVNNHIYKFLFFILYCISFNASSQDEKVWFDGMARSFFTRDVLVEDEDSEDTVTPKNVSNGYNLLDLNTHVNPIEDFEIFAQLRLRNTFGGFFGSGTTINVRQLRASGVINKKVKFSLGDIFLNQTRFTLHNYEDEMGLLYNENFNSYRDIVCYENFYLDDRWRMQGLQLDFSFEFDRFIRSLEYDFFITRPRGSLAISDTYYLSDQILSGGSMHVVPNNNFMVSMNYVNTYEIPTTGTTNISLRNPVYHWSISHNLHLKESIINQVLEVGFSKRYWQDGSALNGEIEQIHNSEGMFLDYSGNYFNKDSTLTMSLGYRYIDPNFRSTAAQTKRINYNSPVTLYPDYNHLSSNRQISLFDLISDENIYNQELSTTLMGINPAYSNVLPYGDATPNRNGFFIKGLYSSSNNTIVCKLNSGVYSEVIGQGTDELRSFSRIQSRLKLNFHQLFGWSKKVSISTLYSKENTNRDGKVEEEYTEIINLKSRQLGLDINLEFANQFIAQMGVKSLSAIGNEYLNQRNIYGVLEGYDGVDYNQKDMVFNTGILYQLKENVYANLQYNIWGVDYDSELNQDYNFNRIFFVLSVKL